MALVKKDYYPYEQAFVRVASVLQTQYLVDFVVSWLMLSGHEYLVSGLFIYVK